VRQENAKIRSDKLLEKERGEAKVKAQEEEPKRGGI
jgi:hypothetical protein